MGSPQRKGGRGVRGQPRRTYFRPNRAALAAVLGALSAGAKMGTSGWGVACRSSALMSPPFWWNSCNMPQHHRDATRRRAVRATSRANERETNASTTGACLDEGEVVLLDRIVDAGHWTRESWIPRTSSFECLLQRHVRTSGQPRLAANQPARARPPPVGGPPIAPPFRRSRPSFVHARDARQETSRRGVSRVLWRKFRRFRPACRGVPEG